MTLREFREAYARLTSHGWLTFDEAALLVDTAERTTGTMVSFGAYMGRSDMLLGRLPLSWSVVAHDKIEWVYRPLVVVDPWDNNFSTDYPGEEIYRRWQENIKSLPNGGEHVTACRMKVEDWTPVPAGFVYCDGDHTYQGTLNQIDKTLACGPSWIAVHDVDDDLRRDVPRACVDRLGKWREKVSRLAVWQIK